MSGVVNAEDIAAKYAEKINADDSLSGLTDFYINNARIAAASARVAAIIGQSDSMAVAGMKVEQFNTNLRKHSKLENYYKNKWHRNKMLGGYLGENFTPVDGDLLYPQNMQNEVAIAKYLVSGYSGLNLSDMVTGQNLLDPQFNVAKLDTIADAVMAIIFDVDPMIFSYRKSSGYFYPEIEVLTNYGNTLTTHSIYPAQYTTINAYEPWDIKKFAMSNAKLVANKMAFRSVFIEPTSLTTPLITDVTGINVADYSPLDMFRRVFLNDQIAVRLNSTLLTKYKANVASVDAALLFNKTGLGPDVGYLGKLSTLDRMKLVDKIIDIVYANYGTNATSNEKIASEIVTNALAGNYLPIEIVASLPIGDQKKIAGYVLELIFNHKSLHNYLDYFGLGTNGGILMDPELPALLIGNVISVKYGKNMIGNYDEVVIRESRKIAHDIILNIAKLNEIIFVKGPEDPPIVNAPIGPTIIVDSSAAIAASEAAATASIASSAATVAVAEINAKATTSMAASFAAATVAAAEAQSEQIATISAANLAAQKAMIDSQTELAKVQAAEETAREIARQQAIVAAAKASGATIVQLNEMNTKSANEIARQNAIAVDSAAKQAGAAAVQSVQAALGPNGVDGILGTVGNMLNSQTAQNNRLIFEQEQLRQIEAQLAAEQNRRSTDALMETQRLARIDALNAAKLQSSQVQQLIDQVQKLQKTDTSLKTAPYSEILTKLVTNTVVSDKQSCRMEVSAKQSFDFSGNNVTMGDVVMKQRVTVSASCYQDSKKLAELQKNMSDQVKMFAAAQDPKLLNTIGLSKTDVVKETSSDITNNFNAQAMQDMISIANGDQSINISATNSTIQGLLLDQTADIFTQVVQQSVASMNTVQKFANELDNKIANSAVNEDIIPIKTTTPENKKSEGIPLHILGMAIGGLAILGGAAVVMISRQKTKDTTKLSPLI